jgi:hypothetical protein
MFANCYFSIAKYHIYNKNKIKALYYLCKSIFAHPLNGQTKYKINIAYQLIMRYDNALKLIAPY